MEREQLIPGSQSGWLPPGHLLALIYETMTDGVVIFDTHGRVHFCNPAMGILTGRPLSELVGKTAIEAWGGAGSALGGGSSGTASTAEERLRRPDGSEKIVTSKSFPITSAPPLRVVIYRDITRIRETRRALEETHRLFHDFLARNPAMATLKDNSGRYVFVNQPAERILARPSAEWIGKTDRELWPPDVADRLLRHDNEVRDSGVPLQFEESLPTPDGTKSLLTYKFRLGDSGQDPLLASMSLDMSQLKNAQGSLRRRLDIQDALLDIAQKLANPEPMSYLDLTMQLVPAMGVANAHVALIDAQGQVRCEAKAGEARKAVVCPSEEVAWLMGRLRGGSALVLANLDRLSIEERGQVGRLFGPMAKAVLTLPIRGAGSTVLGFLGVQDERGPRDWAAEDIRALSVMAEMVASHLSRRRFDASGRDTSSVRSRATNVTTVLSRLEIEIEALQQQKREAEYHARLQHSVFEFQNKLIGCGIDLPLKQLMELLGHGAEAGYTGMFLLPRTQPERAMLIPVAEYTALSLPRACRNPWKKDECMQSSNPPWIPRLGNGQVIEARKGQCKPDEVAILNHADASSMAVVPLIVRAQFRGFLFLASREASHPWDLITKSLLLPAVKGLVTALERKPTPEG